MHLGVDADVLTAGRGLHGVLQGLRIEQAERIERVVRDAVVLVHKEHDLVVLLRQAARDDVILRLQQVFVARELRPDVHLHALAKQCARGIGGYDAEVGEQRAGIDLLQAVVRAVDRQGRGVGIGDVRRQLLHAALAGVEPGLEVGQVVRLGALDHGVHHAPHDADGIKPIGVLPVDALLNIGLHVHHGRKVHGVFLDRQGIGRERLALHAVDERLYAARERQNERDADDADGAREGNEDRAGLLRHQVVKAQRQRRQERHGRPARAGRARGLRFVCRAGLGVIHDAAVQQADDAGGIALGQLRIVRDHDDKAVARDLLENFHDLHARLGVQRAGRLVRQQNVRVVDEGAGDGDALHLAAGHLVWPLVQLIAEADLLQHGNGAGTALLAGNAGERQGQLDVCQHALVRDEIVALKDKADGVVAVGVPVPVAVLLCGDTVDEQVARRVAVQTADDVQKRRLAAAGRTENGDKFIVAEAQAHAAERVYALCAAAVILCDRLEFQHKL